MFIRCRKLNISLVFITKSYFSIPKEVRFNSTHYLIMKIHNRRELQQIAIDHSADIDYKDLLKIYGNCTKELYFFLLLILLILHYLLTTILDLEKISQILFYKNGIN